MKFIKLSFRLIWKKKFAFLLLVLEMIISMIIFIALIGKVQNIYETKDLSRVFNQKNAFYFTPYIYYDPNAFDLQKIVDDISLNSEIGTVADINLQTDGGDEIFAYGYNDTIIKYTNIKMKSGEWFNLEKQYDILPLISIGNKYSVGDIVNLKDYSKNYQVQGQIIGTIKSNEYITTFLLSGSKNHASIDNLVSAANGDFIIPFSCKSIKSVVESDITNWAYNYGSIIITENQIDNEVYSKLDPYGEVSNISSMVENFKNQTRDYFVSNGIVLLIFTLLGIAGLGGINSMLSLINKRRFTIYFMNGLTRKQCAAIEAIRSGTVIVLSYLTVFFLLYCTPIGDLFPLDTYTINFVTFLFVLLYMICIYSFTSLHFVIRLSQQNLIDIYKQKT